MVIAAILIAPHLCLCPFPQPGPQSILCTITQVLPALLHLLLSPWQWQCAAHANVINKRKGCYQKQPCQLRLQEKEQC